MALAFEYRIGTVLQTSSIVIQFYEQAGTEPEKYEPWEETVYCKVFETWSIRTFRWNTNRKKEFKAGKTTWMPLDDSADDSADQARAEDQQD